MKAFAEHILPRSAAGLLVIALTLLGARAAGAYWFDDYRLTDDPSASYTSGNSARCVASDASGGIHVVWTDYRDDFVARVYYKHFDGVSWTADQGLVRSLKV